MASSTSISLTSSSSSHLHDPLLSSSSSSSSRCSFLNRSPSFPFHLRITHKPLHLQNPPPRSFEIRSLRQETRATPVTKDLWENSILKSEIPVLVEFYASWCGPCRMVHRIIDDIAKEYDGRLNCFIVNTDTDMQIAADYDIKAVPVVMLFKNGQKSDAVIGTMPKEFYVDAIEKVLKS